MAETKTKSAATNKAAGSVFSTLYGVDVSGKLDKKPRDGRKGAPELSYLSWAWAWAEVKKRYPDAQYRIIEFDEHGIETDHGYPFQVIGSAGYLVHTELTIDGESYRMWLPVMDAHNQPVKKDPRHVTTRFSEYDVPGFDVMLLNKALMRCLVKNMAIFGLGLTVYAGEDTPDVDYAPQPDVPPVYPPEQLGAEQSAPPAMANPPMPEDAGEEEFDPNPPEEPEPQVDPIALQQALQMQVTANGKECALGDFVRKSKDKNKSQLCLAQFAADTRSNTPEVRSAAELILKAVSSGQITYPAAALKN